MTTRAVRLTAIIVLALSPIILAAAGGFGATADGITTTPMPWASTGPGIAFRAAPGGSGVELSPGGVTFPVGPAVLRGGGACVTTESEPTCTAASAMVWGAPNMLTQTFGDTVTGIGVAYDGAGRASTGVRLYDQATGALLGFFEAGCTWETVPVMTDNDFLGLTGAFCYRIAEPAAFWNTGPVGTFDTVVYGNQDVHSATGTATFAHYIALAGV
ncbi:MAG: hypothetical protein LC624_03965 [Halobacteriales archaeon]|nr:hypothetical protein [Halobacteriales archaeon]